MAFFNDDDSYELTFIEKLMEAADGYDVAFCQWNRIPDCEFKTHHSTSGNYIVRTGMARAAGYPEERDQSGRLKYDSDGLFIERLKAAGATVAPRVDEILYHHNHQP